MSTLNPRVLENIEIEAYHHVRNGEPMGKRGAQYDEAVKEAIRRAHVILELEYMEKVCRREMALATKWGLDYETWLTIAKSLYTISSTWVVTSVARGPENERAWEEPSESRARERVLKLIQYKHYDHFVRGSTFSYVPGKKDAA